MPHGFVVTSAYGQQVYGAQGAADVAGMRRILDVQSYDPPAIAKGHQEWPHYTDKAPVGLPIEKDAVRLQVPTCCFGRLEVMPYPISSAMRSMSRQCHAHAHAVTHVR